MDNRGKWAAPVLVCAMILALMAYIGCYFWLSTTTRAFHGGTGGSDRTRPFVQRQYEYWWMRELFRPATTVESFVTGVPTDPTARDY